MRPEQSDGTDLRPAFREFPTGVVAVCADVDGAPVGFVVSSFVSVSLDPPLVSFTVQNGSRTWPKLRNAPILGMSVLRANHGRALQQLSARDDDRFDGLDITTTRDGAVLLNDATVGFEGSIDREIVAGDHHIVLLAVHDITLATSPGAGPLVFLRRAPHRAEVAC